MTYLLNIEEFAGKTEIQIAKKTVSGEIDQSDLIMHFNSWLSLDKTAFVITEQKPKPPPPKPAPIKASEPVQQSTPTGAKSQGGKQEGRKDGPFGFQKIQPEPKSVPPPKTNIPSMPGTYPQSQKYRQSQNVYSLGQHYSPPQPQDDKPFRLRFYEKIAEYFEYP